MSLLTTAYAGSADIDGENVDALMNQLLPDGDLGYVYIPEKVQKRVQPGLFKVVDWLQHNENGVGVEGTIPVPNLVAALLERNEKLKADGEEEDELVLVMVYDPASGLDTGLAKEAHDAGIRVVNFSAAGDDLTFEDETVPEVPAAEDVPPWEDGPAEAAEKPAAVPASPSPAETVQAATAAGVEAAAATTTEAPDGGVTIAFHLSQESVDALAAAIVAAMGPPTYGVPLDKVVPPVSNVVQHPTAGREAAPAAPGEPTTAYYYHAENATYRPARGRKRDGEEKVELTAEGVRLLKQKGMIA
jgi:hypothetical protein